MKDEFVATFVVDLAPDEVWEALTRRTVPAEDGESVHYVLAGWPSFEALDVPGARFTPIEMEAGHLFRARKDHDPCAGTELAITLEQEKTGTRVQIVQSGFGAWFDVARHTIIAHGNQIANDFRLYLERELIVPGTVWGVMLGAEARETPVGLEITAVHPGGFGEKAGLETGDLLLTLRGIRLHDIQQLWTVLALTEPGSTAEVTWARGREVLNGKATF